MNFMSQIVARPRHVIVETNDFSKMCKDLAALAMQFEPDVVIGVKTGGAFVAESMMSTLQNPLYAAIRIQRTGTRVKSKIRFGLIATRIPRPIAMTLRWAEVEAREILHRPQFQKDANFINTIEGIASVAAMSPANRILLVDDTVDSGATLRRAIAAIQQIHPHAQIRTAVLTSTWRRPPFEPDYILHHRVLLTLPWSFDAPQ